MVNAFNELDVVKAWGDGTSVAADGTQVETYIDNLLAETSIRYGGVGGIAYHYISDTYVALFSRFIPCGVWEAVHLIEGLLANASDIQPTAVHADTQGQSAPVFALATLFGFDLMPRIRNFKDLIFFRPDEHLIYPHVDALFGERGRNGDRGPSSPGERSNGYVLELPPPSRPRWDRLRVGPDRPKQPCQGFLDRAGMSGQP